MKKFLIIICCLLFAGQAAAEFSFYEDFETCETGELYGQTDIIIGVPPDYGIPLVVETQAKDLLSARFSATGTKAHYGRIYTDVSEPEGNFSFWLYGMSLHNEGNLNLKGYLRISLLWDDSGNWRTAEEIKFKCSNSTCQSLEIEGQEGELNIPLYEWNYISINWATSSASFRFNDTLYPDYMTHSSTPDSGIDQIAIYNGVFNGDQTLFFLDNISSDEDPVPPVYYEEDCSGLGTTDRILCEIKNTFSGLFFPTADKVEELNASLAKISEKFPFNYLSSTFDFFSDVRDGLNDSENISVGIFDTSTSSISFDAFSASVSYAGETKSILDYLKLFFSLILLIITIKWLLGYSRRVLK